MLSQGGNDDLQRVFPNTALKRFPCSVLQGADTVWIGVDIATFERILKAESAIEVLWLEEANKSSVGTILEGCLVCLEKVLPVLASTSVLLNIRILALCRGNLRDDEVVVAIFKRTRETPGHSSEALVVKVLHRYVSQSLPAVESTSSFIYVRMLVWKSRR